MTMQDLSAFVKTRAQHLSPGQNASSKHLVAVILLSGHLQDSGFAKERNGKIIFQRNSGSWANVPSRF